MSIWIIGKDLMRYYYLIKKLFTVTYLNMEDITDTDYRHTNKVFKEFKLKNLGEYYDLYVQSDTLLLADVFENFRNILLKYTN